MKKAMKVKLRWSTDTTITALSSWRFGLAQFWNQKPAYYDEYMRLYKMSRIVKTSVKCTVINTTAATPAEIVLVVLPYSDYSRTLAEVKNLPSAAIKYLSGSGGLDKVTARKSSSLRAWTSASVAGVRDYQQSASEAASTLALLPDTPVLALYVGGASTEPTLRVFIEVFYDVVFFEPEWPSSVALTQNIAKPLDMTDARAHQITPKAFKQGPRIIPRVALRDPPQICDSKPANTSDEIEDDDDSDSGSAYHWERHELPMGESPETLNRLPYGFEPARTAEAMESQPDPLKAAQADHPKPHYNPSRQRPRSTEHFTEVVKQIFSEMFTEFNKKP